MQPPPPGMTNGVGPRPGPQAPQPHKPDMVKKEEAPAPPASAPPPGQGAGPSAPTPEQRPATTENAGAGAGMDLNFAEGFDLFGGIGMDLTQFTDLGTGAFEGMDWMASMNMGDNLAMGAELK